MNQFAGEFSDQLAAISAENAPSVVRVEAGRRIPASGVVWADGVIVTAHHAVATEDGITIGTDDGEPLPATFAGRDPGTDLLVLRVDTTHLRVPAWSAADDLRVGHLVLALARPGRSARAALGIVSALGGDWRSGTGGRLERYVESDLGLSPGFSGGLVVDARGRALGMRTSGLVRGRSLIVPVATLERVAQSLLAHGSVRRGFLGIGTYPGRLPAPLAREIGQEGGLVVIAVEPESPAARAGIRLGDVVVGLGGTPVETTGDLLACLDEGQIGTELTARIVRAEVPAEIPIAVGARRWE
jgi:S1-C subfamily serine protease